MNKPLLIFYDPGARGDFLAGVLTNSLILKKNNSARSIRYYNKIHHIDQLFQETYSNYLTIRIDHNENLESAFRISIDHNIKNWRSVEPVFDSLSWHDCVYGNTIDLMFDRYNDIKNCKSLIDFWVNYSDLNNLDYLKNLFFEINNSTMPDELEHKVIEYLDNQYDYTRNNKLINLKKLLEFEFEHNLLSFQARKNFDMLKNLSNLDQFLSEEYYTRQPGGVYSRLSIN